MDQGTLHEVLGFPDESSSHQILRLHILPPSEVFTPLRRRISPSRKLPVLDVMSGEQLDLTVSCSDFELVDDICDA